MTARLISIPTSNYMEKARWALQLAGVAFTERKFLLVVHAFNTRPKGGNTVPLLCFPSSKRAIANSPDILDFCAQELPSLYPNEATKTLELYYDKELGRTRRTVMSGALLGVYSREPSAHSSFFSVFLMHKILHYLLLKPFTGETGAHRLARRLAAARGWAHPAPSDRMVQEVDEKLGDAPVGTKFLVGDIAFCVHMSLVVIPPEHAHVGFATLVDLNYPMHERVEKLQRSKSVQFVSWCYKHQWSAMLHAGAPK